MKKNTQTQQQPLTKDYFDKVIEEISNKLDSKVDKEYVDKADRRLNEKIDRVILELVNKPSVEEVREIVREEKQRYHNEIMEKLDFLVGQARDNNEAREIVGHQISRNTQRIEKLEKKVFGKIQTM